MEEKNISFKPVREKKMIKEIWQLCLSTALIFSGFEKQLALSEKSSEFQCACVRDL